MAKVKNVHLLEDPHGYARCIAIVKTKSEGGAEKIFEKLHGQRVNNMKIYVKYDLNTMRDRLRAARGESRHFRGRGRGSYRSRGRGGLPGRGGFSGLGRGRDGFSGRSRGRGRLSSNPFFGHSKIGGAESHVGRSRGRARRRSGRGAKYV